MSVNKMGIVTNFPVKRWLYHTTLYLTFDTTGPGHYNAATEIEFKGTEIESCKYIFW